MTLFEKFSKLREGDVILSQVYSHDENVDYAHFVYSVLEVAYSEEESYVSLSGVLETGERSIMSVRNSGTLHLVVNDSWEAFGMAGVWFLLSGGRVLA